MTFIKYHDRLEKMDFLIRTKSTGSSQEFAERVGICRSLLMKHIDEMKALGAPIEYNRYKKTYQYKYPCKLIFGFEGELLKDNELDKIKGGECYQYFINGHHPFNFVPVTCFGQTLTI
jgi:biotin operon repressor